MYWCIILYGILQFNYTYPMYTCIFIYVLTSEYVYWKRFLSENIERDITTVGSLKPKQKNEHCRFIIIKKIKIKIISIVGPALYPYNENIELHVMIIPYWFNQLHLHMICNPIVELELMIDKACQKHTHKRKPYRPHSLQCITWTKHCQLLVEPMRVWNLYKETLLWETLPTP